MQIAQICWKGEEQGRVGGEGVMQKPKNFLQMAGRSWHDRCAGYKIFATKCIHTFSSLGWEDFEDIC